MPRFQIFQVQNPVDQFVVAAEEVAAEPGDACGTCDIEVGPVEDRFIEYYVVLAEDDSFWFVCLDCAKPVLG